MNNTSHILLVEDNEDDYEATLRGFRKNNMMNPVRWCKNGQDALDYLYGEGVYAEYTDAKLPGLVLLDLNMPGIDGREVLRRIKDDPEKCSIPVVILTTSKDSRDIDRCYEIGASTYIQKPIDFDGQMQVIRAIRDYWFGIVILPGNENK